jgi:DNA helicase II / ATP-dependent DNA helicase PcrA
MSLGRLVLAIGNGEITSEGSLLSNRAFSAVSAFGKLVSIWRSLAVDQPPLSLLDRILSDVEYRSYIDDGTDEGIDRWENIMELRRLAAEYRERSLSEFLEEIALVSDQDTYDANTNAPTLLTLHAAKGLEFRIVYIVGLVDGVLPHMRSIDEPDSLEEERRLLYVGITRAMDQLYLLYSQSRSAFGYQEPCIPSRFLNDIPETLLQVSETQFERWSRSAPRSQTWNATRVQERAQFNRSIQFPAGMRVGHPVWGEGMVLSSQYQDDDEIVDIFFEQVGLKRVVASLARLEALE